MNKLVEELSREINEWSAKGNTQQELARKMGRDPSWVSKVKTKTSGIGKTITLSDLGTIASILNLDLTKLMSMYLDASAIGDGPAAKGLQAVERAALGFLGQCGLDVNLIVRGDRRDVDEPRSEADLLANAPSTIDLYYLGRLGAPPTIVTDQLMFGNNHPFRDGDWLSIASPNVNLCTRELNESAFFRFRLPQSLLRTYGDFKETLKDTDCWDEPKTLEDLSAMRDGFKDAGVIDPFDSKQKPGDQVLHGLVTIASHPWDKDRVVVVAAGTRGLATALAVEKLSDPTVFVGRPFGGLFSVPHGAAFHGVTQVQQLKQKLKWVTEEYSEQEYADAAGKHPQFSQWWTQDGQRLADLIKQRRQ